MKARKISLVIHGGAGPDNEFIRSHKEAYLDSLCSIFRCGYGALEKGRSALYVVEHVVAMLEDNPLFNAGHGAALNAKGDIEMDASIMDGRTRTSAAVCGLSLVRNPIKAAELIRQKTDVLLVAGASADALAEKLGASLEANSYFLTPHRLKEWEALPLNQLDPLTLGNRGTVGAVALDIDGNLAAGTSTGGVSGKLPGRVSDSYIIGAGCYAENQTCAVSCTGDGEIMMREFSALSISQACCHTQHSLQMNCEAAVYRAREKRGDIGVIALNQKGEMGIAFNSERMMRAWCDASGNVITEIY